MRKGFTLIEVIIVITIIIILSVTIVLTLRSGKKENKESSVEVDTSMIGSNWIVGGIYKFKDGDTTCYATSNGISCLK